MWNRAVVSDRAVVLRRLTNAAGSTSFARWPESVLDEAGVAYEAMRLVGPIAETIVEHATKVGVDMIFMGTRGMSALANMALGSVTTRVLHLAHVPVMLVH